FRTNHANTSGWYSSRRVAEKYSGYKVLIEEGTDRILGAHLLGSSSDELINIFAVAIRSGMPATVLREAIFAYPTHGSDVTYMLQ
ncbi:MAG: NAD(P)/FAD-dependent oxidoreductase, partial [Acidobacteriota bacterium]|nr:NAD(P)/FAD-dependent oxidoreductase [Acidobacteriota bacterium]